MNAKRLNTAAALRGASRKIAQRTTIGLCAATLAMLLVPTASARAQADTARDSLTARLRRAEQAIASLQQQVADQAQSAAHARSGAQMEFHGRVAVNGFGNSRRVNNVDDPQFVRPDTTAGIPVRGIGMAIRQTTLGLGLAMPGVLGG